MNYSGFWFHGRGDWSWGRTLVNTLLERGRKEKILIVHFVVRNGKIDSGEKFKMAYISRLAVVLVCNRFVRAIHVIPDAAEASNFAICNFW